VAMQKARIIAKNMGFSEDRIEDLKTALAEACINAIEHGNHSINQECITVYLAAEDSSLRMVVRDSGKGFEFKGLKNSTRRRSIPHRRGWGIFMIRKLVNEVSFDIMPDGGSEIRMVIHLEHKT